MSKLILSNDTHQILKNFATINSSIMINAGNVLKTISVGQNSIAEFKCEETFPQTFGIYDLSEFLTGMSLFDSPVLEFAEKHVNIIGNGRKARYYFSSPEITLQAAPEKDIKFPGADIEFNISSEDIKALKTASVVYSLPDLSFSSVDGKIAIKLFNKEDDTSNVYEQTVTGNSTGDYDLIMKMENLRLHPGDYHVEVSTKKISQWKHQRLDLTYFIALEP